MPSSRLFSHHMRLPGVGFLVFLRAGVALAAAVAFPAGQRAAGADLNEVLERNQRLEQQVAAQQRVIEEMSRRMADLVAASERHERELRGIRENAAPPPGADAGAGSFRGQEVRLSAEMGVGFFRTGRDGQFPESELRLDDPVITIEAPVMKNVYFFTELKLLPRETNAEDFEIGEMYVDFEDVSSAWNRPGLLSFRAGRLAIPFGEEYLVRTPTKNPLISHSLSDIWGVDEGIAIYGRLGPTHYILAVQNGGPSRLRDFDSDKSVAARWSWDPGSWWRLSASAMRTGDLLVASENVSEVWFGNGFFRALGPSTTTATYGAELYEVDGGARWQGGQASAAWGRVNFDDSDTLADNSRRMRYGYLEVVQGIADRLYGAARYSEIQAPRGYPLAGWGRLGTFFFRPVLTRELRRFSLGLGYRFGPPLIWKVEYTRESGRMTTGEGRDHEDFFGSQIAVKF